MLGNTLSSKNDEEAAEASDASGGMVINGRKDVGWAGANSVK